jgi:hypothetical protein
LTAWSDLSLKVGLTDYLKVSARKVIVEPQSTIAQVLRPALPSRISTHMLPSK